ncbi:hypothetical protein PTKIN_Ptkin05aG0091500 [Pterospermum kingtungense]
MMDLEPSPQTPNNLIPSLSPPPPSLPPPLPVEPLSPSPTPTEPNRFLSLQSKRPSLRVTSEFDSDSRLLFHKVSCKLFDNDNLAKLKLSFISNSKREISDPQLAFTSKYLSIHYDPEEQNALIKSSFDVGSVLHFKAAHDVKPKATIRFPMGEVMLEEREEEEVPRTFSINGILKGPILNGVCAAHYMDEELKLRYSYKDEEMSFIPSISLPSNAVSFAFKRRFSPSDKLSYWYNLDSNYWSAVYKHTYDKDFKFKAGYDSEVRLGWASLWVGDENGRAKTAPMKMKVQFMLQVPQDDIKSSTLMFRVKKRWDIL